MCVCVCVCTKTVTKAVKATCKDCYRILGCDSNSHY